MMSRWRAPPALGRRQAMTRPASTLDELLESSGNSFNAVRLFAAVAVVISHAFLLSSNLPRPEPLDWGPFNLSASAVNVFFFLSGLMLSRSYDHVPDWRAFATARVLRIFPALLVAGVAVGWVLGPMTTQLRLDEYFANPETLLYPLSSTFTFAGVELPGVFVHSKYPEQVNVPLWTIKYELLAYLGFGIISVLGLLRSRFAAALFCVLFGIALAVTMSLGLFDASPLGSVIRFGFCFLLGVAFYRFRSSITVRWPLAAGLLALALALTWTPLGPLAWIVAPAYAALVLAEQRIPFLTAATNRTDISFGLYIYAWPIQQLLVETGWTGGSAWLLAPMALVIACGLGLLSWHFIEKPALSLKRHFRPRPAESLAPAT